MPTDTEKLEKLKQRMAEIRWYHRIDLGPELGVTPGGSDKDQERLAYMKLPASFAGLDVVDIGSWDGFFAFEAERRGASRVIATDIWGDYFVPNINMRNLQDGLNFAIEALNSKVAGLYSSVYDLCQNIWEEIDEEFMADVVICPGVLYHLRNPLHALQEISNIMSRDGLLIVETHLDLLALKRPAIALYRGDECANDATNFTGPNPAAVETLLEWAGFHNIEFQGGINLDAWPDPHVINYARGAWHARK